MSQQNLLTNPLKSYTLEIIRILPELPESPVLGDPFGGFAGPFEPKTPPQDGRPRTDNFNIQNLRVLKLYESEDGSLTSMLVITLTPQMAIFWFTPFFWQFLVYSLNVAALF